MRIIPVRCKRYAYNSSQVRTKNF